MGAHQHDLASRCRSTYLLGIDDYFRQYDGVRAEWVRGIAVELELVDRVCYEVTDFLRVLLELLTEDLGGQCFSHSFGFKTQLDTVRLPDVMLVLPSGAARVEDMFVIGAADLIIEVICPGSFESDRGAKFLEYEASGVREYWIVDPLRQNAEFLSLEGKRYRQIEVIGNRVKSKVLPRLILDVGWLWQRPPMKVKSVLRDPGL